MRLCSEQCTVYSTVILYIRCSPHYMTHFQLQVRISIGLQQQLNNVLMFTSYCSMKGKSSRLSAQSCVCVYVTLEDKYGCVHEYCKQNYPVVASGMNCILPVRWHLRRPLLGGVLSQHQSGLYKMLPLEESSHPVMECGEDYHHIKSNPIKW